jgi:hypothetical protein
MFAVTRKDAASGEEVLLVFNTSNAPLIANLELDRAITKILPMKGACPSKLRARGSLALSLAPLDYMVCTLR